MTDPHSFSGKNWRDVLKNMRGSLPVNKFEVDGRESKRMPAIHNPLIIGGLGAVAIGWGAAAKYLKPMATDRQDLKLQAMLMRKLNRVPGLDTVAIETKQSFGKPLLVRAHLTLTQTPVSAFDLLARVARYVWDGAPKTPVALQILLASPGQSWTLTDIGFADEVARPDELYKRFGSPASDPNWKP